MDQLDSAPYFYFEDCEFDTHSIIIFSILIIIIIFSTIFLNLRYQCLLRNCLAITIGYVLIISFYSSGKTSLKLLANNSKGNRIVLNRFSLNDPVQAGIEFKGDKNTTNWDESKGDGNSQIVLRKTLLNIKLL